MWISNLSSKETINLFKEENNQCSQDSDRRKHLGLSKKDQLLCRMSTSLRDSNNKIVSLYCPQVHETWVLTMAIAKDLTIITSGSIYQET